MESRITSFNTKPKSDESLALIGQELVNFVIKTSESLHNVILKAKNCSDQQTIGKRKSNFKKKRTIRKSEKAKTDSNVSSNSKTKLTLNDNNYQTTQALEDSSKSSIETKFDYEFEMSSSSYEELYDIPMEELLSSPSWKQIVEQNSFVWP